MKLSSKAVLWINNLKSRLANRNDNIHQRSLQWGNQLRIENLEPRMLMSATDCASECTDDNQGHGPGCCCGPCSGSDFKNQQIDVSFEVCPLPDDTCADGHHHDHDHDYPFDHDHDHNHDDCANHPHIYFIDDTVYDDDYTPDLGSGSVLLDEVPALHSNPGAPATIYIDFDGGSYAGYRGPYDRDGDPNTFSESEVEEITTAWNDVVINFSMFDVNVTTEQPDVANVPTRMS